MQKSYLHWGLKKQDALIAAAQSAEVQHSYNAMGLLLPGHGLCGVETTILVPVLSWFPGRVPCLLTPNYLTACPNPLYLLLAARLVCTSCVSPE